MNKLNFLHDLSKKLAAVLPENLKLLKDDVEKNFQAILQATFNKLDIVTREEFDVQVKVLARSRKKITELEKKIGELEKIMSEK